MKQGALNEIADAAAERYASMLSVFGSIRHSGLLSEKPVDALLRDSFREGLTELARYTTSERDKVAKVLATVVKETLEALSLFDVVWSNDEAQRDILALMSASSDYLINTLAAQGSRDLARMRHGMHSVILHANGIDRLTSQPSRVSRISAMMALPEERYVFTDRLGRDILSERFVRNVTRQVVLSVFNETTIVALSTAGHRSVKVFKENDKGETIAVDEIFLDGTSGKKTYLEVRDELFHPNSRAYLGV